MTELYVAARRYLGTPWGHKGRSLEWLDCAGLLVLSAIDCGWDVRDVPDYSRRPQDQPGKLEKVVVAHMGPAIAREPISIDMLLPSDVVTMHFDHSRVSIGMPSEWPVCHVGIIGTHRYRGVSLIHTDGRVGRGNGKRGKVVEQGVDEKILASIAAVYRRAA